MATPSTAQDDARLRAERVAREDLVTFINAAFACTGQAEYYADTRGQDVSIAFLHEYILGNYRRLYARCLAVGVNHFNRALIVENLLAAGAPSKKEDRAEESELLRETLRDLPPPRVWRLFGALQARKVNNRRTRAVVAAWMLARRNLALDALKYRPKMRVALRHVHTKMPGEVGVFVNDARRKGPWTTPLFATWKAAQTEREAVFRLPYSVAEGFAPRHKIGRHELLTRMADAMTEGERRRVQTQAAAVGAEVEVALDRMPLTKLCRYVLSLSRDTRIAEWPRLSFAMTIAAERIASAAPLRLGRVALVLDASDSSSGSVEKARGPLAVALAVRYLVKALASAVSVFWTPKMDDDDLALIEAGGTTDLATPLIEAWKVEPRVDAVFVVSDGHENDPPGAAKEVLRVLKTRIDKARRFSVVHLNPVFDSERFGPRALGGDIVTVGLRDAEDLPTVLGFVRFAEGTGSLAELEAYLAARVARFLHRLDDADDTVIEEAP